MLKIVLDTNMIISASVFGGMVEKIIDLIVANKLKLFISSDLTKEVFKKLNEFQASKAVIKKVITVIGKGAVVVPKVNVIACRDPKDNFILELVETTQADYLITRDKDLLQLPKGEWKGTKIVKPEEFFPHLRSLKLI